MSEDKYGFLNVYEKKYNKMLREVNHNEINAMINKLINEERWDLIFKYFNLSNVFGGIKQTKESCMEYLLNKSGLFSSLRFVIKQDDELVLAALENNIENIKFIRVSLKKATMVEIDLLYAKEIEKSIHLKFWYTILMEKAI